jgi:hypothetical protein
MKPNQTPGRRANAPFHCLNHVPWISTLCAILFLACHAICSAGPALLLTAEVNMDPPEITLHWQPHPEGLKPRGFTIWRKHRDSNSWGDSGFGGAVTPYATGTGDRDGSWTDPDPELQAGVPYEYRVVRHVTGGTGSLGFICAGIDLPPVHQRGRMILVIDRTMTAPLSGELARLEDDLAGDGWSVVRLDFDRGMALTNPGYGRQVQDLRREIQKIYQSDPDNTRAVLLIGHLPVPYTGDFAYDWHDPYNDAARRMPWHLGAWPADTYYGEMTWEWADEVVHETRSDFSWNHNVPGDGKFDPVSYDQIYPGGPKPGSYPCAEMWVGRVDLYDLPAFSLNEEQLLRRYLDKHHAYRHGLRSYERRGLIDYNIREAERGIHENNGPHRSFSTLFGPEQVHSNPKVDWFPTLGANTYLWAAGAGYSGFTNIGGIGTTADFASKRAQVVFTSTYGSYFGDWDNRNNILRAPLGNEDILTSVWLGPQINANFGLAVHHMALGIPIGYALDATHYRGRIYHEGSMSMNVGVRRGLQMSLMGDPTLRLHVVAPPSAVTRSSPWFCLVRPRLSWSASPEAAQPDFMGYYVYAADDRRGPFTLLNPDGPITDTRFTLPRRGGSFHMVRAVKLERTPSGTYQNLSQGSIYPRRL